MLDIILISIALIIFYFRHPLPPKFSQSPYKEKHREKRLVAARDEILNGALGAGFLLKRNGWIISVYLKYGDSLPKISIKRVNKRVHNP